MRLFVALELEDRMKDALIEQMRALRPHTKQGRFSHRENLHLTLCFIGETGRVAQAKRALHRVQAEPFVLSTANFAAAQGTSCGRELLKMNSWRF